MLAASPARSTQPQPGPMNLPFTYIASFHGTNSLNAQASLSEPTMEIGTGAILQVELDRHSCVQKLTRVVCT